MRKNRELKIIFLIIAVFFAAFLAVPVVRLFVKSFWGEQGITGSYFIAVFTTKNFTKALGNSFLVSICAAVLAVAVAFVFAYCIYYTRLPKGVKWLLQILATLPMYLPTITYGFAIIYSFGKQGLITARSSLPRAAKQIVDAIALITSTIPGMVLGLAYLFAFSGSSLQNTMTLMVLCNIVHYFSTPYLMMKNSLSKMNAGWETTAMLMGDNWLKTILRVVTPNAASSLIEVFSYSDRLCRSYGRQLLSD